MARQTRDLGIGGQDLNRARQIFATEHQHLQGLFQQVLRKAVKALDAAAREAGEPARGANRPNGQVLGEMVRLIL